jgi:hypothetical protein
MAAPPGNKTPYYTAGNEHEFVLFTQFWRSYEDLNAYASAKDRKHAPAWGWWNALAKSGTVGIWHETYRIAAGSYESIYGFMPAHGLAKATNFRPLAPDETRSKQRMEKPV